MRIDLVSEHASPLAAVGGGEAGGQNVHVAALAAALGRRGLAVRVFTRRDDPALPRAVLMAPNVEVVHLDAGPPEPVPRDELWPLMGDFALALQEEQERNRPDVCHAHFWMSAHAALRARDATEVPVAVTFHALGAEKRRHQGAKDTSPSDRIAVEAETARAADLVLATTVAEVHAHLAAGVDRGRVIGIPCGVDLDRFRPPPPRRRSAAAPLRVAVVSRLVERKGIGNVIEAVAACPEVELVVAGGPPPAERDRDPELARYRALAEALGAADRVRFLGALDRERVPELMRSVDAVACCPWYEPFGLVAVEAMACGLPVVASEVGGLAETVVDGHTGLHVPPRDPTAIAAALRLLAEEPRLREQLGLQALRRARRYGWPRIARATHAALARTSFRSAIAEVAG